MSNWPHTYEISHCPRNHWNYITETLDGIEGEKFELRCGDFDPTTLEKSIKRERAEASEEGTLQRSGESWWYAWSFQVPEDYQDCVFVGKTSGDVTFAQFHQKFPNRPPGADWDPPWMFGKQHSHGPFRVRQFPTYFSRHGASVPEWTLIPDQDFRGRWHEIVVHARWSSENDGLFEVWVNGDRKVCFSGTTCFADGGDVYCKHGLYRAAHPANPNAVVRYRGLSRGSSATDVTRRPLNAAFSE